MHSAPHQRSTVHKYGARLIKMTADGCTLAEIGKALGITRERVRQIIAHLGIQRSGEIRRARKDRMRLEDFLNTLPHTRLGRFLAAARAHGLTSELVPQKGQHARWISNQAEVNGKLVLVKGSTEITNYYGTPYIRVVSSLIPVDLIAYELPDGRWAFFEPWGEPGISTSTMFSLRQPQPGDKGYTYHVRHDHREAIENWALLAAN